MKRNIHKIFRCLLHYCSLRTKSCLLLLVSYNWSNTIVRNKHSSVFYIKIKHLLLFEDHRAWESTFHMRVVMNGRFNYAPPVFASLLPSNCILYSCARVVQYTVPREASLLPSNCIFYSCARAVQYTVPREAYLLLSNCIIQLCSCSTLYSSS